MSGPSGKFTRAELRETPTFTIVALLLLWDNMEKGTLPSLGKMPELYDNSTNRQDQKPVYNLLIADHLFRLAKNRGRDALARHVAKVILQHVKDSRSEFWTDQTALEDFCYREKRRVSPQLCMGILEELAIEEFVKTLDEKARNTYLKYMEIDHSLRRNSIFHLVESQDYTGITINISRFIYETAKSVSSEGIAEAMGDKIFENSKTNFESLIWVATNIPRHSDEALVILGSVVED
ncbi:MAG: hypothetical protein AAB965_01020 [Patescibacteria group bacterium]